MVYIYIKNPWMLISCREYRLVPVIFTEQFRCAINILKERYILYAFSSVGLFCSFIPTKSKTSNNTALIDNRHLLFFEVCRDEIANHSGRAF